MNDGSRNGLLFQIIDHHTGVMAMTKHVINFCKTFLMMMVLVAMGAFEGIVEAQDKNVDLLIAAVQGDTEKVEILLKEGADVNSKDNNDRTALIRVSSRGHIDVVKLLLDRGADINARSKTGETALLSASGRGGLDVIKLLLEHGADVTAKNKNDQTVLMLPCWAGQVDVVKLLLDKGADFRAKDKKRPHCSDVGLGARPGSSCRIVEIIRSQRVKRSPHCICIKNLLQSSMPQAS